jgi:5'-nucleotidase
MLILISNDDGIHAAGINALADEMTKIARVIVVAPDREQSATSHALTMYRPLRVNKVAKDRYAVDGTPSDCVTLAVGKLLGRRRPDLIISGINHGPNMGDDVMYSGTVAAAFEGYVNQIPSIAVSQLEWRRADFRKTAELVRRFVESVPQIRKTPGVLLNMNVPGPRKAGIKGLRITRLGHRVYTDVISEKIDPRGRSYYWIAGTPTWYDEEDTDHAAIKAGYVSVTPLKMDYTNYALLDAMRSWSIGRRATSRRPRARKRRGN